MALASSPLTFRHRGQRRGYKLPLSAVRQRQEEKRQQEESSKVKERKRKREKYAEKVGRLWRTLVPLWEFPVKPDEVLQG